MSWIRQAFLLLIIGVVTAATAGITVSTQPVASGFARPDALVSVDWLAAHLADSSVRIVDLRPNGYAAGHIPGAVHLENAAIRDPRNPPTFVPGASDFETRMGRLGISNRTRVVAYDERGGLYAARLWWILHYFGHENVALLDGGWTKWARDGRPTAADTPEPAVATFAAKVNPAWIATAADVVAALNNPNVKIIDARTAGEIEGRDLRGIKRGGAIPGSIPIYWEDTLEPEVRTLKAPDALRRLLQDRGVKPGDDVIAYCQVGMRASHDLFVLYLLGFDKLRNYYGAWEEWGNRDDLPIKK